MPTFSLIDEPCIPCVRADGSRVEYGLRDVLLNAHTLAEVRDDSPLVTVALHRLLLAILHRCYRGPKSVAERAKIRDCRSFDPAKVSQYLAGQADRFDLFHDRYPFYQTRGFEIEEAGGVNRLSQELACNNNPTLFDHSRNDAPGQFTPAEAARAVLSAQAFAVGGGVSKQGNSSTPIPNFTNAPLVAGACTLLRGDTLFETLWSNLTIYDGERPVPSDPEDAPIWERPTAEPHRDTSEPRGYLDYLTWQSRTIRLHPEEFDGRVLVRRVSYAQGRRFKPEGVFFDPMFAVARRDRADPFRPVRFNEFRDLWRDSAAWYQVRDDRDGYEIAPACIRTLGALEAAAALPRTTRLQISVSGLCINSQQAADVLFWRQESLPFPQAYLKAGNGAESGGAAVEQLKLALRLAEAVAADALRKAAWVTAAARLTGNSGMSPDADRVRSLVESFAPDRVYWSRLECPYRELLVALAEPAADRPRLVARWFHDTLVATARHAFRATIGRVEGGRNYKAAAVGGRALDSLLAKVQRAEQIPDRNPQDGAA